MGQPYKGPPDAAYVDSLVKATNEAFKNHQIDDPEGVKDDKIYLFSGAKDSLVPQEVMDAVLLYYIKLGVNPANIKYVKDVPAEHAMVTSSYGNDCSVLASPYIDQCGSKGDTAHQILEHIYGPLKQPLAGGETGGAIIAFDQSKFFVGGESASMDRVGHAYVPKACTSTTPCKLHVALHGCSQNDDEIQAQFYTHAGYNEWAETNNIIVLYPQVQKSYFAPQNPFGCWDWWGAGYTGSNYNTKSGKQVAAVKRMIDYAVENGSLPSSDGSSDGQCCTLPGSGVSICSATVCKVLCDNKLATCP
jgi:hypothetical protein